MALYVDGVRVATRASTTVGPNYYGYWRVGGDATWSGAQWFDGRIDEVAVYPTALTRTQVADHYSLGSGGGGSTPRRRRPSPSTPSGPDGGRRRPRIGRHRRHGRHLRVELG